VLGAKYNNMKKEELSPAPVTPVKVDNNLELKALLEKNLALTQKNLELSEELLAKISYVRRYIFWKKVMGVILWIFIILSTVVSLLYLPTWIKDLQGQMQSMITPGLIGF